MCSSRIILSMAIQIKNVITNVIFYRSQTARVTFSTAKMMQQLANLSSTLRTLMSLKFVLCP